MRQLGICPPQLLASLPITTLFLPRGTRLFFFFSVFLFSSQCCQLYYRLSFSVCPQLAAEIQTPSSNPWDDPDKSLLTWAGSWGATGWLIHVPRAWLGGRHHKPDLTVGCVSQVQSPVIKQGAIGVGITASSQGQMRTPSWELSGKGAPGY